MAGCSADPAPETSGSTPPTTGPSPSPSASATPRRSDPLTGATTAGLATRPVVAVKIDNTSAARPQLGLGAADHVWVEEVEAGLTRLIAVFHTSLPDLVGPVRSARSTDVELLGAYGAPLLVYSGANGNVTGQLRRSTFPTVAGGAGFRRLADRPAPYNLTADLPRVTRGRRLRAAGAFGLTFAPGDPGWTTAEAAPASTTITVGNGRQRFDLRNGRYAVSTAGQPVTDGGAAVSADNVVVLAVRNVGDGNADVNGVRSVRSRTVGSGRVTVLRDGRRRVGRWQRASATTGFSFTDAAGPISLKPGRTWFLLQG